MSKDPITLHPETSASLLTLPETGAPVAPIPASSIAFDPSLPKAMNEQRNLALEAYREIAAHPAEAAGLFAGFLGEQDLARALVTAHGWSDELHRAREWYEYTRRLDALAWQRPLALIGEALPGLAWRLAREPELAERFPALVRLATSRSLVAKKGARKRASKKAKEVPTPKT